MLLSGKVMMGSILELCQYRPHSEVSCFQGLTVIRIPRTTSHRKVKVLD